MRSQIIYRLKRLGRPALFHELADLPGFSGEAGIGIPSINIVYWPGLSLEASLTLLGLIQDEVVSLIPTRAQRYIDEEHFVALPVASDIKEHSSPHWFPVVIRLKEEYFKENMEA